METMRLRKKSVFGRIDSRGKLDIFKGEIEAFCKLHPNRSVVIRLEVMPRESSEKTKGYYFSYILPTIKDALYGLGMRMDLEQVDEYLRGQCPIVYSKERVEGKWRKVVRSFEELDTAESNEYLEWLKEYAAENLYCIIDDP